MTATIDIDTLMALSPADKHELIGLLWDSIPENDVPPLTEAQMAELDRRLDLYEANPGEGRPWEEVYQRVMAKMRAKT